MHCISWYHCLKDTSVFPGVVSLLNVLMLWVPNLSLAQACWGGYQYLPLLKGDQQAAALACWIPIPSPWRATSPSSKLTLTLPTGACHWPKGDPNGGAIPSILALFSWSASSTSLSWVSSRCLMARWSCSWGLPLQGQADWGKTGKPHPQLDSVLGCQKDVCPLQPCTSIPVYL